MQTDRNMLLVKFLCLCYVTNAISNGEELNNDLLMELIKEVHVIKEENVELKKQVAAVVDDNYKLKAAMNIILTTTSKQQTDEHVNSKRLIPVHAARERAAFSAKLQHDATNLKNYEVIVFDQVVTNVGNAYSSTTGAFTAPSKGTYFFTGTIMNLSGEYIEAEIARNGITVALIYSKDREFEQGSNNVVLALEQGNMVWMRHTGTEGRNISGNSWSSFSGFQISGTM